MTCKCANYGYRPDMSYAEVRKFVADEEYCTSLKRKGYQLFAISFICPTVAKHLRTFDHTITYQDRRRKQLKRDGYTAEQIEHKLKNAKKRSKKGGKIEAALVEFNFDSLDDKPKKRGRVRAEA